MSQPIVEVSLYQDQIIKTMQKQGIYQTFMAQLARIEQDPNRDPNALVCMEYADGRGTVYFIQYHFNPESPGWLMATITNACPDLVEFVRRGLAAGYTAPIKPLYVDDARMRN